MTRLFVLLLAVILSVPFVIAACLDPDSPDLGIHPCAMRTVTGLPCPSCGATHAWAHMVHGSLTAAVRDNWAMGPLFALACALAISWCIHFVISGRAMLPGTHVVLAFLAVGILAVLRWTIVIIGGVP